MANIGKFSLYNGKIVPTGEANVSVTSSAVLYGLSVYSVFYGKRQADGSFLAFRLLDHLKRLRDSSKMIGFTGAEAFLTPEVFTEQLTELITANTPSNDQFFRVTIHATEALPGVRTAELSLALSIFMYDATPILPASGARLKTSLWRRTADASLPARAKVNGAYVNSALARQDALHAGADDALLLNSQGYVSELSAANVFLVKNGCLVTPDCSSDILEGITRRSIITLAKEQGIEVTERKVALTEFYIADEVFACGTSAFTTPIIEIDKRPIGNGQPGPITTKMRNLMQTKYADPDSDWTTLL